MQNITGIVLAGGRSTRMGTDKAMISLDGRYLYQIAAEKLSNFCNKVYVSVNQNQALSHNFEFPIIIDKHEEQGPMGGLITSLQNCEPPFLVMAVDLIRLKEVDIQNLIRQHNSTKGCTMFYHTDTEIYEPLLSIWEFSMLDELNRYFMDGGRSFQKFLKSRNINRITCDNCAFLYNANTPDSFKT